MMQFLPGNHVSLLRSGAEYFPALEAAIANAEQEVYLQTYIFELDATGYRIGSVLMQAAQRGVAVHLLLDGFGSKSLSKQYVRELQQAGVQVMFYRPKVSPWTFKKSRLRRLHRKVVVVDSKIAFVGGINIIDDNDPHYQIPPRVDYAVCVEGAIVPTIVESVYKLWRRLVWSNLHRLKRPAKPELKTPKASKKAGIQAVYLERNNVLHRHDIELAYLDAISKATTEIIIANAYFLPGKRFRQALLAAAKRGVAVKLLLQGRKEYFLMFATHAYYQVFLDAGVEIYEHRKSFMHSKVAVIDNEWVTVGSSNIDPFSLLLSLEANVFILDKAFAHALKNEIDPQIKSAYRVTTRKWNNDSKFKHLASWVAYGVVRFFLGVIGYSKE
ncbi:MAG: cardiolipin synthase ClsB [Methylophilus sp.]|nr:cardiolipin synthase ClsB [Methylophilus sp.]